MNDLHALFVSELKAISDGEHRLFDALADLQAHGISGEVRNIFEENRHQAKSHLDRLNEAFDSIGQEPDRKTCHGVKGIIAEGRTLVVELEGHSVSAGCAPCFCREEPAL